MKMMYGGCLLFFIGGNVTPMRSLLLFRYLPLYPHLKIKIKRIKLKREGHTNVFELHVILLRKREEVIETST